MKRKPTGFIAKCQCGETIGALDARRTEKQDMGRLLGEWLFAGCTVEPKFKDSWSASISGCRCERSDQ